MADSKKIDDKINAGIQNAKDKLAEKMIHLANKESAKVEQETVYNVVFTGVFTKDEKVVVAAMAKFFKQGQEATKRLLKAGRVIKTFPEKAPADKLAKMLNNVGLSCKVDMEVIGDTKDETLLHKVALSVAETDAPRIHIPKPTEISWKGWVGIVIVVGVLGAGGAYWYLKPPVVSGDSFASYQASVNKVITKAPEEDKASLKAAIDLLTGAGFAFHDKNTFGGSEAIAAKMAYGGIDGMNAKQIVAAAEKVLENKRATFRKEIADTQALIDSEKAAIAKLESGNGSLRKISAIESKYSWTQRDASPHMIFKIVNNSSTTLSRIYFQSYLYDQKGNLLATKDFMFGSGFGIRIGDNGYVEIPTEVGGPLSVPSGKENWSSMSLKVTVEQAVDMSGQEIGVDTRPNYKRIADAEKHMKEMEKQLAAIKLVPGA